MVPNTIEIKDKFYVNGKPVQIISGAIHYFRIVPEYWRDRLEKLKAMGCNTVETYVPWNLHEPQKGTYCFEGILDIKKFLEIAAELELWVIFRPSPYICAEWEFGGLPAWLLAEDGMRFRSSYPGFMQHTADYYKKLFEITAPLQLPLGGPIILIQIENEYGYYADDTGYLEQMKQLMADNGACVPFVTSDGPWGDALACGKLDGVLPTGNFGSKMKAQFDVLKEHTNGGPLMCMEFWVGWFDHWGNGGHKTSNLEENCKDLDEALQYGNINIYMFIGGTNFGFMNGSNYYDELTPDVTSYDYDAVLTECGDITPKYEAFREIIGKYVKIPNVEFTTKIQKKAYGRLNCKERVGLFESLEDISVPIPDLFPKSMEKLGQSYGYTLYRSFLIKEKKLNKIRLYNANDRAKIYISQEPVVTLYDRELLTEHEISCDFKKGSSIDILMENMGRVNFGPYLDKQRKGIDGSVVINDHQHMNWEHYTLPLDNLHKLNFTKGFREQKPAFYRFEFLAEEKGDTFIDMEGWGKGCVFINGFNLGRFWEIGPQKTLYLPAPLLKEGINEIIVFETEGKASEQLILRDKPDLG
ncbi:beta-galactosidase [Anaerocolumna cellulosilytica]|uniref:Beta-galactosidase n=1 Tax=Anaerocolumna cellulosilytica TaxID=433286 RepID=A0A6S6R2C3_9FIRM|nr:beta-galactosidase family protein [Anaerocolumna cellulosilytica]MBB5197867.1 beta-galactosidase [Anaerocolumna cellulosilytica]BCJ93178.1 beta-galactosidase [Anaerocolumna cellulosilytica]